MIDMYHCEGFLQGGSDFNMTLLFETKEGFAEELERLSMLVASEETEGMLESYLSRNSSNRHALSGVENLRVLHCYSSGGHWNHGQTRGYSWDEETRKIYYWTASW